MAFATAGMTGSSGYSNYPHLHFESIRNGRWFEPSSGPCRGGESYWRSQPPVAARSRGA